MAIVRSSFLYRVSTKLIGMCTRMPKETNMKHHHYQQTFGTDPQPTDWDGIVIVAGCLALALFTLVCTLVA
jgi:hypothetical protein